MPRFCWPLLLLLAIFSCTSTLSGPNTTGGDGASSSDAPGALNDATTGDTGPSNGADGQLPSDSGRADTGGTDGSTANPDSGTAGPVCDNSTHSGEGTYYNADGTGNCSFDATSDLDVAAMNQTDYAGSAVCGACILVTGPKGQVTVRIVDRCPECAPGDVDLSQSAFGKMADISAGRVPITWHFVPCAVQGPIAYHFKEGSNQWWSAVQVRNHRHAIAKFEVEKNGSFTAVQRENYNFFVDASGMGPGPYTFRVTDVYGQVLVDSNIPLNIGGVEQGKGQFSSCQ